MFNINSTIKLVGKTQKGKNRVRELGELWRIVEVTNEVLFSSVKFNWAKIEPIALDNNIRQSNTIRWIHLIDDKDFGVSLND